MTEPTPSTGPDQPEPTIVDLDVECFEQGRGGGYTDAMDLDIRTDTHSGPYADDGK